MPNTDRRACKQKPLERSLEHLSHYGPHFLKTIPRPLGRRPRGPLTLQDHSRRLMQDHSKTIREGPFRDHPRSPPEDHFQDHSKTTPAPKVTPILRFETKRLQNDDSSAFRDYRLQKRRTVAEARFLSSNHHPSTAFESEMHGTTARTRFPNAEAHSAVAS